MKPILEGWGKFITDVRCGNEHLHAVLGRVTGSLRENST